MLELLVAITISLLVCLTLVSVRRVAAKSDFKDLFYAATAVVPAITGGLANPAPMITGFDNAQIDSTDPLNHASPRTQGNPAYGSDILILRHQVAKIFSDTGVSDRSMIDCAGNLPTATPADRHDRLISILHVAIVHGEPTLMCSYSANGTAPFTTVPLVQGVENFQVLYGTNNVRSEKPSQSAATTGAPGIYLRADQLTVAGNPVRTNNNWRGVRSLRIGMILRMPPNARQKEGKQTLYPPGQTQFSARENAGSAMSSADDSGTVFKVPADGRLRQVVTFTLPLRNDLRL